MDRREKEGVVNIRENRDYFYVVANGFIGSDRLLQVLFDLPLGKKAAAKIYQILEDGREDMWTLFTRGGLLTKTGIKLSFNLQNFYFRPKFNEYLEKEGFIPMTVASVRKELNRNLVQEYGYNPNERLFLYGPNLGRRLGYWIANRGGQVLEVDKSSTARHETDFLTPIEKHLRLLMYDAKVPHNVKIPYYEVVHQTALEIAHWCGVGKIRNEYQKIT